MQRIFSILVLFSATFAITAQVKKPTPPPVKPPFNKSLQAIVVTTDGWEQNKGTAELFERKNTRAGWNSTGDIFPVTLGRNGLGGADLSEEPVNDAPTLGPVFMSYCTALRRRDDRALAKLYSSETLKYFRGEMREAGIRSISKYIEDDTASDCYALDEAIVGETGRAIVYSDLFPTGIRLKFVKEESGWKLTNISPQDYVIGMALHDKSEGDGRSPAGLFPLTVSFGTSSKPTGVLLPYTKLDQYTECVDDPQSSFYNRIVNRMQVGNFDWKSSEKMLEIVPDYNLGVFVAYNTYPVEKDRGSCIFLHIWKDANSPTAGCTAMERRNLERIINWLSPARNPYLVQMPKKIYDSRRKAWNLPKLK